MSRATVLARGRVAAEAGMVDACTIRRNTGETTDPFSGETSDTYVELYDGKCRFQQSGGGARANQQDAGEAYLLLQQVEVQLPISVTGLMVGDVVTITAAGRDEDLVGRVLRIRDLMTKTDSTARRVQVEEITS
jgi:hypothetical protein